MKKALITAFAAAMVAFGFCKYDASAVNAASTESMQNVIETNVTQTIGLGETVELDRLVPKDALDMSKITVEGGDEGIVSVDLETFTVEGLAVGSENVSLTDGDGNKVNIKFTVKSAPTEIYLTKTSITVGIGEQYRLTTGFKGNETSYGMSYSSSDDSVATVDDSGTITAFGVGSVKITATAYNGKTADCTVTVKKAPTKVYLNKTSLTLGIGEQYDLNSSLPSGEGAYYITYFTNNSSVAEVKKAGGMVTAKKAGTAKITATTYNGKTVTCTVTVKKAPTKVYLNKTSLTLGIGEQFDLNSSLPSGEGAHYITYSTNNSSVAEVKKAGGMVTAKKAGTAKITATTYNGKTVTCTVTVKKAPTKVYLNKTSLTLGIGEQYDLNSSLPSGEGAYYITYSTNNSSVAEVKKAGGMVTAKKAGTAKITATTYNGKKVTCTVTVKKTPTKITLNKTSLTLFIGQTYDLNSRLSNGEASYHIAYTSSNSSIAEVKKSGGLVTAKRAGTVKITATTYNNIKTTCTVKVRIVDYNNYYTVSRLYSDIKNLYNSYPESISVRMSGFERGNLSSSDIAGKSVEGRTIPLVKFGTGSRKALIVASIHGVENIATSYTMRCIEEYAAAYKSNSTIGGVNIKSMFSGKNGYTLYIVPMANPDSLARFKKNSTYADRVNANGVNLNNDFVVGSEGKAQPETKYIMNLCAKNNFEWAYSMHCAGNVVYSRDKRSIGNSKTANLESACKSCGFDIMPTTTNYSEYRGGFENWFRYKYSRPGFCVELVLPSYMGRQYYEFNTYFDSAVNWSKTKSLFALSAKKY